LKYGALSAPTGAISIEGKTDRANGGTFSFVWSESGGPAVAIPTRKGFGSVILLDAAKQFAEHVAMDYAPRGLHYELQIPLSAIEAAIRRDQDPTDTSITPGRTEVR
jgi:two-component sensor histidine kinase